MKLHFNWLFLHLRQSYIHHTVYILPLLSTWTSSVASLLLGIFSSSAFSPSTWAKACFLFCWRFEPVLAGEPFFITSDGCGSSVDAVQSSSPLGFDMSEAGSGVWDWRWDPLPRPLRPRPRPLPLPLPRPPPGGLPGWGLLLSACWRSALSSPRFQGGVQRGFLWTGGSSLWAKDQDSCLSSTRRDARLWEILDTLSLGLLELWDWFIYFFSSLTHQKYTMQHPFFFCASMDKKTQDYVKIPVFGELPQIQS